MHDSAKNYTIFLRCIINCKRTVFQAAIIFFLNYKSSLQHLSYFNNHLNFRLAYSIGSPTISGINSFLFNKIILLLSPRLHCLRAVRSCTYPYSNICYSNICYSSMILLNRNEFNTTDCWATYAYSDLFQPPSNM